MNRFRLAPRLFRVLQPRCGENVSQPLLAGGSGCFQSRGQAILLPYQPLEIRGAVRDNPEAGSVLPDDRCGEVHDEGVHWLDLQRPVHGIPLIETRAQNDQQIGRLIGQRHRGMMRPGIAKNTQRQRMILREETLGPQGRRHGEIPRFRKAPQETGPLGVFHPRSGKQDNPDGRSSRCLAGQVRKRSLRCRKGEQ